MLVASLAAVAGAYALYVRKEGINRPSPRARRLWWVWIIIGAIVLLLFLAFFWSFAARPSVRGEEERAAADHAAAEAATQSVEVRQPPASQPTQPSDSKEGR